MGYEVASNVGTVTRECDVGSNFLVVRQPLVDR
jgi:hypothetical protein